MQAGRIKKSSQLDSSSAILAPGHTYRSLTEKISTIVLTKAAPKSWLLGLVISFILFIVLLYSIGYLFMMGVGIWGINIPVGWGFAIISFVWWIGIGHAGTLISAILLLFRQNWRTSINRFAEAMTIFAVTCAGLFPIIHLGRPWLAYYIFPLPGTLDLWPQFRSPLVWDAFAITTYGTVSFIFWFIGLIPDLASLRDRAENKLARYFYGVLALGWRGSAEHWHRFDTAYLLLAALATPLVVSVHSIVSFDFAVSVIPGWHTTVFPPYFVAGAIFSGFAMVLTLLIPLRKIYKLEDFITMRHLDNMAKVMLATGLVVAYGYMAEAFTAWYSGNPFERFWLFNRTFGPFGVVFWALMLLNVVVPQALWSSRVRATPILLFVISILVNIGMWIERFVIIVVSLHRDFLPSSWALYSGTIWDWLTFLGTIGLFLTLIFLFIRVLPMVSIFEMRHLLAETNKHEGAAKSDEQPSASLAEISQTEAAKVEAPLYGLMAEFDDADALLDRAKRAYQAGYRKMSAHSPFPVEGLSEAIGQRRTKLPLLVFAGGVTGALTAFLFQYYTAVIDYPLNVGGRPLNSWPSFIIVTFEITILVSAGVAALGMLLLNKLPMLYHPVFNAPRFKLASQDKFFLCIEVKDPKFEVAETRRFLEGLGPTEVVAVEK